MKTMITWVMPKDAMPKHETEFCSETVLAVDGDGDIVLAQYDFYHKCWEDLTNYDDFMGYDKIYVKYWAALPEKPIF